MEMFQESLKRNIIVAVGISHFLVISDEEGGADSNYVLIDGYGVRKDTYVLPATISFLHRGCGV